MVSLPWFANLKTSLLKYFSNSIDISWQQGYIHFSVLLSKDRQTRAVGNGRLLSHFFWKHFFLKHRAWGIGHRASGMAHRASGIGHRALGIIGCLTSVFLTSVRSVAELLPSGAIDCKIIKILRFLT